MYNIIKKVVIDIAKIYKFPDDHKDYICLKNLINYRMTISECEEFCIDYNGAEIYISHMQDAQCRLEVELYFQRYLFFVQHILINEFEFGTPDIAYSLKAKDMGNEKSDLETRTVEWDKSHDTIMDDLDAIMDSGELEIFDIDFYGNIDLESAYEKLIEEYLSEEDIFDSEEEKRIDELILFMKIRQILYSECQNIDFLVHFMKAAMQEFEVGKDITFSDWFKKWNTELELTDLETGKGSDLPTQKKALLDELVLKITNNR